MKRFLKFTIILVFTIIVASTISVMASTGNAAEGTQTWLAELLETYGVPSAIAAIIGSFGTGGAIYLLTRGFKNSKKQMISALEKVGLTSNDLTKLIAKLDTVEHKLEQLEAKSKQDMETTYQDRVIPLLSEVKDLQTELIAIKKQLNNGALKVINLLTEEIEKENQEVSEV